MISVYTMDMYMHMCKAGWLMTHHMLHIDNSGHGDVHLRKYITLYMYLIYVHVHVCVIYISPTELKLLYTYTLNPSYMYH